MKKLLLCFFMLFSGFGVSQNKAIDSLLLILKIGKEDTNKVNTLIELGIQFKLIGDPDNSLEYTNLAYRLSQNLMYRKGLGYSLKTLGDIYLYNGNSLKAANTYSDAIKILEKIHDKKIIGIVYNNIGITYFNRSDYSEALKNYLIAERLNIESGNKKQLANTYNNLGAVYKELGNYNQALKYLLATLKLREQINESSNIIVTSINIASLYGAIKKNTLALENFSKALSLAKKVNDKKSMAMCYNGIGNIYFDAHDISIALEKYTLALNLSREINDIDGLANSYNSIAVSYDQFGDFDNAIKNHLIAVKICEENEIEWELPSLYNNISDLLLRKGKIGESKLFAKRSLTISKKLGRNNDIKEAYLTLAMIDSAQSNYSLAYEHRKLYSQYKDSLINEDIIKKMTQTQVQFEFDKKEAIAKADQEKKDALVLQQNKLKDLELKQKNFLVIGLSVFLFLILGIGLLIFRQNKLKAQQEAVQLEQKLLRLQMNPHFIFNCLQAIQNFTLKNDGKQATFYLSAFGALTRSVLENSRVELVSLKKEIALLEHYLNLQRLLHGQKFTYDITVSQEIDQECITIPPMLAQPFIENAIEHGFKEIVEGGLLEIKFKQQNHDLILEIVDNGKGINPAGIKEHQSLATRITKERIELYNKRNKSKATFTITEAFPLNQDKGVKVSIVLPLT